MARPLSRRVIARYVATQLIAGEKTDKLATQLAAYLLLHRRTNEMETILRDVSHHLAEAGYVEATVTVAETLGAASEAAVKKLVKDATGAKEVSVAMNIDESVIGGVKIETPGAELDATIAHQLQALKTRYKKA
ncbi:F0F1 ATP synthase subunit delta [Candidatus Saccharibacteria bacterium TM7i]|nr:F0F1 ATP synthase subunit delta [Candidatus Saccharibacteria bacterium TM7i]